MANDTTFPDHGIDPRKKDEAWVLQYAKAALDNWNAGMPVGSIFYAKKLRNEEIRNYGMNMQSIEKYKLQLLPEDSQDEAYSTISWEPPANGMVLINIAVAKLQKEGYNILCTAINPLAKDAQDEEYANAKLKIMMREALEQHAPQLADDPSVKRMPGEADNLEELKMQIDFSPKFIRAKDTEEAVQLVLYENGGLDILDLMAEDFIYHGVSIVKDALNENNKVICRHVKSSSFICSYSDKANFNNLTFAGEMIPVSLSDLSKKFGEEDIKSIKDSVAGKNGNPANFNATNENNGYDIFKAQVLDLEFISYNKMVTEESVDKNGTLRISRVKPSDADKVSSKSTFTSKNIEVVYKCKWVIGTDYLYDFGLVENTKRSVSIATMGRTSLSYHVMAGPFFNMKAKGLVENMISIIDDLCIATYKLRMFRNEMIPNGLDIDIAALEGVALGAGGAKLTTADLLSLLKQKGILLSRRSGISMDNNVNYKAVQSFSTNQAENLTSLFNDIQASKQGLRDVSGLNELTDGSTPNARMLTTTANLANESTNNALWAYINPRKKLVEKLAKGIVLRLQTALKRGPYDGFNKEEGRWISVPDSIKDLDYDIMIEDKASDDEKNLLYSMMQEDIKAGNLDSSDAITIINTCNIKQAQQILAYRVKTNKQKLQDNAAANTQNQNNAQIQSNQQAELLKDQMADKAMKRTMEIDNNLMSWSFAIAQEKNKHGNEMVAMKAASEILQTAMPDPNQPNQDAGQQPMQSMPGQDPSQQLNQATIQQQ